jgi:triacylglycerol lipase
MKKGNGHLKVRRIYTLSRWIGMILLVSAVSCAAVPENAGEKIPIQYPVVLVHGILCHDRGDSIDFWGRIPQTLRKWGALVYFGNTDAWGSYKTNALLLKESIETILKETGAAKVNIIAHSKGGIDSRYLIWRYDFGDKVASLTTLSTPHRGAETADLLAKQKFLYLKPIQYAIEKYGILYGDIYPDLYAVLDEMTTAHMKEFNETVIPDDRVYYQSIYTVMHNPFDEALFGYTYTYLKKISGFSDGIVSEKSASWGDNPRRIPGSISHSAITDWKQKSISGINIPDIYVDIIRRLSRLGF